MTDNPHLGEFDPTSRARPFHRNDFIDRVMRYWDQGMDTKAIALEMNEPEAAVARWVSRERRRTKNLAADVSIP